ncbi:polysaccharide pyruvyl transferase family protein [Vibrio splendidus]
MKIATITYHRAINYGAILQCYALQKSLHDLGYESEVLDYRCAFLEKQYRKKSITNLPTLRELAVMIIKNGNAKNNQDNFRLFMENEMTVSPRAYTDQNIGQSNQSYDKFIVGSDQVWSYFCSGFDQRYFLDFVQDNTKKISYAASFGVDSIPNELQDVYFPLISSFNKISVREEQAKSLVSQVAKRDSEVVLDPTLLLDKKSWSSLASGKFKNRKYVLLYMIAESKSTIDFAKNKAKENGCEVIYISDRLFKKRGVTTISKVPVYDWIDLFLNADFVVTNSFHGLAFSINFEKQFYADLLPNAKVNSRILNILKTFDFENRLISYNKDESILDFSDSNKVLDKLRSKSLSFLVSSLNG